MQKGENEDLVEYEKCPTSPATEESSPWTVDYMTCHTARAREDVPTYTTQQPNHLGTPVQTVVKLF